MVVYCSLKARSMLKPLKRHFAPCKRSEWDQRQTRCGCPIYLRGTLKGKRITLAVSKFLPEPACFDLAAARNLALLWERTGEPVRPEESAPSTKQAEPP